MGSYPAALMGPWENFDMPTFFLTKKKTAAHKLKNLSSFFHLKFIDYVKYV